MNDTILITNFTSVDDLYEEAYNDLIEEGYDQDLIELEDELIERVDELYYEEVVRIECPEDLEYWWRENGWTLDRGYGGPNYKERVADNTDWYFVWENLLLYKEVNNEFGYRIFSPVEINDFVIFADEFEDIEYDEDLLEESKINIKEHTQEIPDNHYIRKQSQSNSDPFEDLSDFYVDKDNSVQLDLTKLISTVSIEDYKVGIFDKLVSDQAIEDSIRNFKNIEEYKEDLKYITFDIPNKTANINKTADIDQIINNLIEVMSATLKTTLVKYSGKKPLTTPDPFDDLSKYYEDKGPVVSLDLTSLIYAVSVEDFSVENLNPSTVKRVYDKTMRAYKNKPEYKADLPFIKFNYYSLTADINNKANINQIIYNLIEVISEELENVLASIYRQRDFRPPIESPKKWDRVNKK